MEPFSDDESRTLAAAFADATKSRQKLETLYGSTNDLEYQTTLAAALSAYEECLRITDRVALFSPNESLEDVATSEVQFLLVQYYLGDLTLRRVGTERKAVLLVARLRFEGFLQLLDSYDVLRGDNVRLWESYKESRDSFSVVGGDAASRRERKIARHREEKEMKRKLEALRRDPRLRENDDAAVRELHLAQISLAVHDTFQSLEMVGLEMQMLAQAPAAPPPSTDQVDARMRQDTKPLYSERLDPPLSSLSARTGPILDKDGRPMRPFTILSTRQRMQQGVFRPDHNLPTMTIDEYLEEERRRGGIIEGGGEKSGMRPEVDEDDLDKADEETMKARAWDEFKEDNPRGSGNTMNRG